MKRITSYTLVLFVLLIAVPVHAQRTFIVGVPGGTDKASAKTISKLIVDLIIGATAGDKIQIVDGMSLQRICTFDVPQSKSARSRLRKVRKELSLLAAFLKRAIAKGPAADRNLIRLPEYLAMAAKARTTKGETRIIVVGLPFYRSKDPAFSFGKNGLHPSDGHALAKSSESPFGCAGKRSLLSGRLVDICYLTEDIFSSPLNRNAIRRWWSIFVSEQSGVLSCCSASATSVVESALSGNKTPAEPSASINRSDTRIELRRAVGRVAVTPKQLLTDLAKEIPVPEEGFLSIASVWGSKEGAVDVDLWVQPSPSASEIYFENMKTPEGRLLSDVQKSNPKRRGSWEVVEVQRASLRDMTCWLNLYASDAKSRVDGLVRITYANRAVDVHFSFSGPGDGADGKANRDANSCWTQIDVAKIWSAKTQNEK